MLSHNTVVMLITGEMLIRLCIEQIREVIDEKRKVPEGYVKEPIHQEAKRLTYYLLRKRSLVSGISLVLKRYIPDPYTRSVLLQPLVKCIWHVFRYGYDDKLVQTYAKIIDNILRVG